MGLSTAAFMDGVAALAAGDSKLKLCTKFLSEVKSSCELEPILLRLSLLWCDFLVYLLPGLGMAAIVGIIFSP